MVLNPRVSSALKVSRPQGGVLITKFSEAPRGWCLSDFIDSKTKKKGQINTQDHSYRRGHRKAARFTLRTTP